MKERRRLASAVEELEARGATQVIFITIIIITSSMNVKENEQVHIRAASWRGGKEERRTLPRTLLTKMVRIRLKTEVVIMLMMRGMVMVEMMIAKMVNDSAVLLVLKGGGKQALLVGSEKVRLFNWAYTDQVFPVLKRKSF